MLKGWVIMETRNLDHNFKGEKLKLARIVRGLTLEDVAREVGLKHQAISKYEVGKSIPNRDTLLQLAEYLNFEPSFFYNNQAKISPQSSHFFRSGAAVAKKYKEQVKGKAKLIAYLMDFFESELRMPKFIAANLLNTRESFEQIDFNRIDKVAEDLRRYLGLGNGPISNITLLCEKMGIVVVYTSLNNEQIDACTVFYNSRPYIIVNNCKISSVRLRFNVAHELGHILLHSSYKDKDINDKSKHKRLEREAHRFASAFLMPESSIVSELSASGLDYLLILKEHWKVSVQAILYRAEELEVFSTDYAVYLRQQISRKKWRIEEPLDNIIPKESSSLFNQAVKLLNKKNSVAMEEIIFKTGLSKSELYELCLIEDEENASLEINNNHNVVPFSKNR